MFDETNFPASFEESDAISIVMIVDTLILLPLHVQMLCNVKSFNFMVSKFRGFMMMDMFMDTLICGFQIKRNITHVNKYFGGILNLWIVLPMKHMK